MKPFKGPDPRPVKQKKRKRGVSTRPSSTKRSQAPGDTSQGHSR